MYFGQYANYDPSKSSTYNFYGLNRTRRTSKGEFSAMKNMSTMEYPCAAPTGKRKFIAKAPGLIQAVCSPDSTNVEKITGFTGIAGGEFYYNGERKGFATGKPDYWEELYTFPSEYKWQIIRKGNMYIFNGYNSDAQGSIMYWYNIDTDTFGDSTATMRNLVVRLEDTTYNGEDAQIIYIGPENSYDNISNYSAILPNGKNINLSNFYYKYCSDGASGFDKYNHEEDETVFSSRFAVGDRIVLKGFPDAEAALAGQVFSTDVKNSGLYQKGYSVDLSKNNTIDIDNLYDTSAIDRHDIVSCYIRQFVTAKASNYSGAQDFSYGIVIQCYNKKGEIETLSDIKGQSNGYNWCAGITISKYQNSFERIGIHKGRVWGVIPTGDQIYASASDQIFSWSADDIYQGYAARIPSDTPGTFTGLCSYSGDMIAFKESAITVISGDNPSNYYSYDIVGIGCVDPNSVVVTPSGVIFLSYNGFYIFTGNIPQLISSRLNTKYVSAMAGYDGNIYYASAIKEDGVCELLAYDLRYNVWHIIDDTKALGIYTWRGKRYIADNLILYEWQDEADDSIEWSFTSVRTHLNTLDMKAINELWIRCEMGEGAEFTVETRVDDGIWRKHATFKLEGLQIFHCPIRMNMGSNFQYRISGRGMVVFYEIETQTSYGGRQYKELLGTQKATVDIDIKKTPKMY